jgi:hypothetical protein
VRADESDRRQHPLSFKLDPLCYFADKHPGRLIITPHIAGFTMQSVFRTEIRMRKMLKAYLEAQSAKAIGESISHASRSEARQDR